MKIGFSSGYTENYWGDWFTSIQIGGSERICIEVACTLAQDHEVTVRLPYKAQEHLYRGVRWIGLDYESQRYNRLYCFDDFLQRDRGDAELLVACRSDSPLHTEWDQMVFLSGHHADLMGYPGCPAVGGGVNLSDYADPLPRIPKRVICTSSPDRCPDATAIGRSFDFIHSYRPVGGVGHELHRESLVELQKTAQALIYPLNPRRPSDFFSMAVLEAMAAGTPVVVSDADSMPELWSGAAIVLPRPIDYGAWYEAVDGLLTDRARWRWHADRGRDLARRYSWDEVSKRYLSVLDV